MLVHKSLKTELDLNNDQKSNCIKHAGCARFAYNWGLQEIIDTRKRGDKNINSLDLNKKMNALKKSEFSWMYEVSKCAPQEALRDLDVAFGNFFKKCRGKKKNKGFPKFKSKKNGVGSFRLYGRIIVFNDSIQLPRLGVLRLKEFGYLPSGSKVSQATISEKNGRWYVSVLLEVETVENNKELLGIIGVDLGIKSLAVLSTGEVIENPKHRKSLQRKVKRMQRSVSRGEKDSNRRTRSARKLAKLHEKIANRRKDMIHKFTTKIVRKSSAIGIEDLNVSGMMKNRHLAGAIGDASFYEIRRQLEYKSKWANIPLVVVDRFAPTSKTCSNCGYKKEVLKLSERVFRCVECGLEIDRDLNAALNIRTLAASYVDNQNGRGSESSGASLSDGAKLSETKRQPITSDNGYQYLYSISEVATGLPIKMVA